MKKEEEGKREGRRRIKEDKGKAEGEQRQKNKGSKEVWKGGR